MRVKSDNNFCPFSRPEKIHEEVPSTITVFVDYPGNAEENSDVQSFDFSWNLTTECGNFSRSKQNLTTENEFSVVRDFRETIACYELFFSVIQSFSENSELFFSVVRGFNDNKTKNYMLWIIFSVVWWFSEYKY